MRRARSSLLWTALELSSMESFAWAGFIHSFQKVYQEIRGKDPGRIELDVLKKSVLKLLADDAHKVLMILDNFERH